MTVSLYETGLKAYAINYTIHADDSALIYSRDYRFQNHPFTNINPSSVIPGIPQSAKGARAGLILRWAGAAGGFIRAAGHRTHSGGGRSFLGSGNKKDGGGFWHQSQNPRCSERRKSFRIST